MDWTKKNYLATEELKSEIYSTKNLTKSQLYTEVATDDTSITYKYSFTVYSGILNCEGKVYSDSPELTVMMDGKYAGRFQGMEFGVSLELEKGRHILSVTVDSSGGHKGFKLVLEGVGLVPIPEVPRINGYRNVHEAQDVYIERLETCSKVHRISGDVEATTLSSNLYYDEMPYYTGDIVHLITSTHVEKGVLWIKLGNKYDYPTIDNVQDVALVDVKGYPYTYLAAVMKNNKLYFVGCRSISDNWFSYNTGIEIEDIRTAQSGEVVMYKATDGYWYGLEGFAYSNDMNSDYVKSALFLLEGDMAFIKRKLGVTVPSAYKLGSNVRYYYSVNNTMYRVVNNNRTIVAYAQYLLPMLSGTLAIWGNTCAVRLEVIV